MLALGIILVVLAVGLALVALAGGGAQPASFDLGAVQGEASTFAVFLAGSLTLLLLMAGLVLISSGLRAARKRRQDKKELHRLSEKVQAQEAVAEAPKKTHDEKSGKTSDAETAQQTRVDSTTSTDDTTLTDQERPKG